MRENSKFRNDKPMTILGVPHVVVREPVHVGVHRAVGIDVHVRNEEYVQEATQTTTRQHYDRLNFIQDIEVL